MLKIKQYVIGFEAKCFNIIFSIAAFLNLWSATMGQVVRKQI
jgi:hypothetical protein